MNNLLDVIPGYREAIAKEELDRDASFLPLTESVAGFELRQMTLEDYLILRISKNPLLWGGVPTIPQLTAFLWLLSPGYNPQGRGKSKFIRRCRRTYMSPHYRALFNTRRARARHQLKVRARRQKLDEVIDAVCRYVEETMQDRPPVPATVDFEPAYYADAVGLCALFGREYGWSEASTLKMPLKRIFQYLNERRDRHGSKVPLCNPSDRVKADYLRAVNRRN